MPRTEEQFEEIRQKRRLEIIETALELFAQQGYHNTSISKITKTAGVSKGLMYNYFESKEALLDAILFGAADEKQIATQSISMNKIPPKQRLQMMIEGMFAMIKVNLHHWKLMMSLSLQDEISTHIKEKFSAQRKIAIQEFIQLFEELGAEKPELEAFFLGSSLTGVMMQYLHLKDDYPLEEMKNYLINKFCE
ncbi:MAG: TetR/AcrR family transcriptional regulator [Saprospiraceae bacterium]